LPQFKKFLAASGNSEASTIIALAADIDLNTSASKKPKWAAPYAGRLEAVALELINRITR